MTRKLHSFFASFVATAIFSFTGCTTHTSAPPPANVAGTPAPGNSSLPVARGGLRLPGIFSDNMVLQQGMTVPIWGWGEEDDTITVAFRNQKVSAKVKDGKWMVKLKDLKPGGPDVLTISGKTTIQFSNVLVGDVWVASGQSNMEFAMRGSFQAENDIASSANPMIRLITIPKLKANDPTNNVNARWVQCGPETVPFFSAVAYYFGRDLQKARGVPIGLIHTSWGGSPAEVWMSQPVLESNPRYKKEILETSSMQAEKFKDAVAQFEKEQADAKRDGATFTKRRPTAPWKATELYNGMIAPLIPFAIKGAIWYQGESNAGRAEQYRSLFADMIKNWRRDWNSGDFTFLEVQLAPFMKIKDQPGDSTWAELREAQLLATKNLPKVGMAVITDVGEENDIHPKKKQPVGSRLALAARGIAYGEKIEFSGPIYKSMKVKGDKAILTFDHVGKGLEARDGALKGFAICGEDKKFVWALAEIQDDNTIAVSSPNVEKPVAVRFGWSDYPVVNLWNKDGLPATPFRTDDFPMITAAKK
jgi:sialate O-acetylesterase